MGLCSECYGVLPRYYSSILSRPRHSFPTYTFQNLLQVPFLAKSFWGIVSAQASCLIQPCSTRAGVVRIQDCTAKAPLLQFGTFLKDHLFFTISMGSFELVLQLYHRSILPGKASASQTFPMYFQLQFSRQPQLPPPPSIPAAQKSPCQRWIPRAPDLR